MIFIILSEYDKVSNKNEGFVIKITFLNILGLIMNFEFLILN